MPDRAAPAVRLLPAPDAARYLGVGVTTLRGLDLRRRELGAKRLYDREDLDRFADELPYEGDEGQSEDDAKCDEIFGVDGPA